MRFAVMLLGAAAVVACSPKEEATPDSAAAVAAPAPAVGDFAGTWQLATVLEGTPDTVKSSIVLTADGGCNLVLPDRPNITCTTSMSGDSLVVQTGEYESILKKGVMTSVRSAAVMSGGMMHGHLVSSYKEPSGVRNVNGTFMGTKAP